MRDFLSNLALRTLAPEATLQPRRRTRFEVPSLAVQSHESRVEDPTIAEELTQNLIAQPVTSGSSGPDVELNTSEPAPKRFQRRRPILDVKSHRSLDETDVPAPHATIRVEDRSRSESAIVGVLPRALTRRIEVGTSVVPNSRSSKELPEFKPKPVLRPAPRADQVLAPRNANETHRRLAETRVVDVQSPAAIHISIGRVEVRAMIQAPATTRRTSPEQRKPTAISLDDYLSRRAHGGKP